MVQDELRRINTIDNPSYLDTVEVIGSIPVAPLVPFLNHIKPFMVRLTRAHPVVGLLGRNPFPDKPPHLILRTRIWAVIDRPYSKGINTVGAVCDRAMFKLESFETETS
jgi:hypothetical protein